MWFEIHCHSNYSDGKHSPQQMLEQAKKMGLDGLVLTDHDNIKGSLEIAKQDSPEFRVYPGIEVSSKDGHILAINVHELIPKELSAQETVDLIHKAGGIAIAAHPYDRYRRGIGDLIHKVNLDAVEAVNGHTFGNKKDPFKQAEKAGLPTVGGTDAHTTSEIGGVRINVPDDLIKDIKAGNTEILRKNPYKLFVNHGIGVAKRRFDKHIIKKIRR